MHEEGIPLWELIKPEADNRIEEIINLLQFYSLYQDQIEKSQESFDLFITELLYAGYDRLISENWLEEIASTEEFLGSFDIPPTSPLFKLTLLLEKYYLTFGEINLAKELLESFPIVCLTRIGRDLSFRQSWMAKRETDLKTDPEKFAIKPISQRDLESKIGSDLSPIIKKSADRFEEQFSENYPSLASDKIISEVASEMVSFTNIFSVILNDLSRISKTTNIMSNLIKLDLGHSRRRGAGKGKHPSKKILSIMEKKKIIKGYQDTLITLREIRAGLRVEKNISRLVDQFGEEYADQIKNEEYPNQLAFDLIREKYKVGKNRLYKIIKEIK